MHRYLVQYSLDKQWVPFCMLDSSVYDALDWVKANIQELGVCVSELHDKIPPQPSILFHLGDLYDF